MPKIGIKYTVGNNFDDVELNRSVICCVERQWIWDYILNNTYALQFELRAPAYTLIFRESFTATRISNLQEGWQKMTFWCINVRILFVCLQLVYSQDS